MSKQENIQIISTLDFLKKFADDIAVAKYIEERRWPYGRFCPHCGSVRTVDVKGNKPMPFRCQRLPQTFQHSHWHNFSGKQNLNKSGFSLSIL